MKTHLKLHLLRKIAKTFSGKTAFDEILETKIERFLVFMSFANIRINATVRRLSARGRYSHLNPVRDLH